MVTMNYQDLDIVDLATEAGSAIMGIYDSDTITQVQSKEDDSPLTLADIAAHETIVDGLKNLDPNTPIVSEEGRVGDALSSEFAWLVDPLDGTKEFIKRNGMFTVNIALMRRNGKRWNPVFGVVHAPVTQTTWYGGKERPAIKISEGHSREISVNNHPEEPVRLVASGSHRSERDEAFASSIGKHDLIRMGSSLKACIVAESAADLYPRFGPTSCWDIAAAHAVVESAGGKVLGPDCETLDYDLMADVINPFFLVTCSTKWNDFWLENQD